jgi:polar amino acid transport system permease protein
MSASIASGAADVGGVPGSHDESGTTAATGESVDLVGALGTIGADVPAASSAPALKVAPTRHPWRWVTFTAKSVLSALRVTLELTLWGTAIGFVIGTALAIARLSNNPVLRVISWVYIWAFRSIPVAHPVGARA